MPTSVLQQKLLFNAVRILDCTNWEQGRAGAAQHKEAIVLLRHLGESVAEDEHVGGLQILPAQAVAVRIAAAHATFSG